MDKQDDWTEFFEKYPDVPEPKECLDPEAEKRLNYPPKTILADEDDLDEYGSENEYEVEPTCSSSLASHLPPTPDLLTRKAESCEYLL